MGQPAGRDLRPAVHMGSAARPPGCRAMCRVLAYVGAPLSLDELLFRADRALVRQAVDPQLMSLLNLGGFGLVAWDGTSPDPERPFTYKTPNLPVYDRNLKA